MFDQPGDHGLVGLDHQRKRGPFLLELFFQFLEFKDEAVVLFLMVEIAGTAGKGPVGTAMS